MAIFWSIFASFSPDIQPNVTFLTETVAIGSNSLKKNITAQSNHIWQKNEENTKNWWNFKKIWDIKANLDKLIALITLKMYINKILYLLSFICFYFMWICFVIFELWHFKVLVCENYQYKGTLLNTCAWNSQEKHCSFSQTLILITEKGLKFKLWVSSGIVKTGSTGVSFENSTSNLSPVGISTCSFFNIPGNPISTNPLPPSLCLVFFLE